MHSLAILLIHLPIGIQFGGAGDQIPFSTHAIVRFVSGCPGFEVGIQNPVSHCKFNDFPTITSVPSDIDSLRIVQSLSFGSVQSVLNEQRHTILKMFIFTQTWSLGAHLCLCSCLKVSLSEPLTDYSIKKHVKFLTSV